LEDALAAENIYRSKSHPVTLASGARWMGPAVSGKEIGKKLKICHALISNSFVSFSLS
jgi:hypothetical protein